MWKMARAMKTQKLDSVCKCAPDVEAHLFLGLELKKQKKISARNKKYK